ncbi:MAG: hypothetical protein GY869_26615, partial [Planctomycetes bacterium]|nr:hypothetical protein [Planctomycetota bacterium]
MNEQKVKSFLVLVIGLVLFVVGACETSQPIRSYEIYVEAVDPVPDTTADWDGVEPGL